MAVQELDSLLEVSRHLGQPPSPPLCNSALPKEAALQMRPLDTNVVDAFRNHSLMSAPHHTQPFLIKAHRPSLALSFPSVLLATALLIAPSAAYALLSQDHNHAADFYRSLPRINVTCPDRSQWMRDAAWIHNRSIFDITLPGTHDSGAYVLFDSYLRGYTADWIEDAMELAELLHVDLYRVVKAWALAQAESPLGSVAGQLRAGARYIDLRCSWNGTAWVTFHFEQGVLCKVLMHDISQFLSTFSSEIVYVEFGGESSPDHKQPDRAIMKLLYDDIRDTLLPFHIPTGSDLRSLTVSQLVAANARCLIASPHRSVEYENQIFHVDSIIKNTYANSDVLQDMIAYNQKQVVEFRNWNENRLFKFSWTLTTGPGAIVQSLLPGKPRSLYELSQAAFEETLGWADINKAEKYPRFGQIFISDFFCESSAFEASMPNIV